MRIRGGQSDSVPLFAFGAGLVAVGCCAVLPLLAAVVGGLAAAAVIGIGAVVSLAVMSLGVFALVLRTRRRRARSLFEVPR